MTTSGETGGDWRGFVVPYRYYGPGYAGLGYYAVYYQGGEGQEDEGDSSQQSSQRNAGYGQRQGAGAAWQSSRSGGRWGSQSGGGYAGRGPKGYRRSDERIREEISDQFMENDQLDASEIEVNVADGVVTLAGTVEDRRSKRLAEDIAERANGVRDVMNQLKVDNEAMRGTGRNQDDTSAGMDAGSSATRTSSRSGSSSGQGSKAGSRSRSATSNASSSSSSSRATRQPVGAGTGGATDGATGNGSNRDQSNRGPEGQSS